MYTADNPVAKAGGAARGGGAASQGRWVCCARVPREAEPIGSRRAPQGALSSWRGQAQRASGERVLHGNTVEVGRTKWLVLETVSYIDAHGVERVWDRCVRTGADGTASKVDAVVIIAILSGGDVGQAPELLLCRQFRPPLDAYTVELPAGLIDTGESPMQAAVRELREETGYIAKADESSISPVLAMSAGLTNESVYVVTVTVDMDLPANKDTNRKQELEETESIDVIRCPCSELLSRLKQMEAAGDMPFCGLWTLAAGMGLGQPASD